MRITLRYAVLATIVVAWAPELLAQHAPTAGPPITSAQTAKQAEASKASAANKAAWKDFLDNRARYVEEATRDAQDRPEAQLPPSRRRSLASSSRNAFSEPPVIRSYGGVLRSRLVVGYADHVIKNPSGEDQVHLRNYNGRLTGPTLRVQPGDTIRIVLDNRLDPPDPPELASEMNTFHNFNTTNLHTHGLHVSPVGNSDNVMLAIDGGKTFEYEINVPEDHPPGTFWYHAHKHGAVSVQVSSGMAGTLIVEGGIDRLPEIEAMTQRLLVLQQLSYAPLPGSTVGVIESANVNTVFGPGAWQKLDHYTTVNGRVLPLIHLRPGEVERWRVVMAGVRETVSLQLVPADGQGVAVPLHQIAIDGLALGKRVPQSDPIQLWPGYRTDLLVQVPTAGNYLLIDAPSGADQSVNGLPEPLKFVARVVVEGAPVTMAMPTDAQLKPFRLTSIPPGDVSGPPQQAIYALGPDRINTIPYDPSVFVRHLPVGATQQWNIGTRDVAHVFHIHVNPFEVISDKDQNGKETLDGPVWHDTYAMQPKHTILFNTRYDRYIGTFVQHCHILDHEDKGMMEQITIDPPGGLMNHLPPAIPGPVAPLPVPVVPQPVPVVPPPVPVVPPTIPPPTPPKGGH